MCDVKTQASEAVLLSKKYRPTSDIDAAYEIAAQFSDRVYIPTQEPRLMDFLRMLAAVWAGGYMAGIRAERAKRRRR